MKLLTKEMLENKVWDCITYSERNRIVQNLYHKFKVGQDGYFMRELLGDDVANEFTTYPMEDMCAYIKACLRKMYSTLPRMVSHIYNTDHVEEWMLNSSICDVDHTEDFIEYLENQE